MLANENEQSPRLEAALLGEKAQMEVCVDLGDLAFYSNLSWSVGVDYLTHMPLSKQKNFLGM